MVRNLRNGERQSVCLPSVQINLRSGAEMTDRQKLLLEKFAASWARFPEQRFAQFLANTIQCTPIFARGNEPDAKDFYYMPDEELLAVFIEEEEMLASKTPTAEEIEKSARELDAILCPQTGQQSINQTG